MQGLPGDTLESFRESLGSYLRLIDSCITQLKAQGPPRTSNESKEALKQGLPGNTLESFRESLAAALAPKPSMQEQPLYRNVLWFQGGLVFEAHRRLYHSA